MKISTVKNHPMIVFAFEIMKEKSKAAKNELATLRIEWNLQFAEAHAI